MLLPSEIASRKAKFPQGEKMTVEEVSKVVGPEFKEMNENPPKEVVELKEEMEKKSFDLLPSEIARQAASGGHHFIDADGSVYVDTAFLNSIRGIPGTSLEHLGFGEFYAETPKGQVDFDRMRGKEFPGQSGRSHKLYGKGGADKWLLEQMIEKGQTEEVGKVASGKTARLMARQEAILRKYMDEAVRSGMRAATGWDELPDQIQTLLRRVKDQETLWSDVDRWFWDNAPRSSRWAKFPQGEKMTVDEVAEVVGPEFKEMNENPPKEVEELKEKMESKKACGACDEKLTHFLGHILAALRAQSMMYQTAHWQTSGPHYYENHLLFERLYGSVIAQIDGLAEKIVGLAGVHGVELVPQAAKVLAYAQRWSKISDFHEQGLASEKDLQKLLRVSYDTLKAEGKLTLGLDDWLMATASEHETNLYLLQQAIRG